MPYFTRKPYAETVADAATPKAEAGVADAAARVLDEDRAGAVVYGPYRFAGAVAAGETARMVLDLESVSAALSLRLRAGPLRCDGNVIPREAVRASPETLPLSETAAVPVEIRVDVPEDAAPGLYEGRLSVLGEASFAIALELEVAG